MNVIDVLILLLLIVAVIRAIKLGLIGQLSSLVGFFGGLFFGAFLQGLLLRYAHSPDSKALLAISVIVACIIVFSVIAEIGGLIVKARLYNRWHTGSTADKVLALGTAVVAFLIGTWLMASVLSNVPKSNVQRLLQSSFILAHLDKTLPSAPSMISGLGGLIDPNAFPDVFTGLEPRIDTTAPLPSIGELDPAVAKVRPSVVKIGGLGCGGVVVGTGFVVDKDLIMTNAHVVAGVKDPVAIDGNGDHSVTVVWFDPDLDIAILRATNLGGNPIEILQTPVSDGTATAVVGYPGGEGFSARPSVVMQSFIANGRDIYGQAKTKRHVYSLRADIERGNSGGPLIDKNGKVVGLIFAESATYDEVGYALTSSQIAGALTHAHSLTLGVDTGRCAQ